MKKSLSEIYYNAVAELTNKTGFSVDANLQITNLDNPPSNAEILEKAKEIEAKEPVRLLRLKRNRILAETDWRATVDYPGSDKQSWLDYRKALRDLPATAEPKLENGQLTNITWPEVPQ